MFDRSFFLSASWTGLTADTQAFPHGKIAFRNFPNVIDFFWQIVNNADETYSCADNKAFLQSLMSRAKHRIVTSGVKRKASRGKNRPPAKQKYKRKEKQPSAEEADAETAAQLPDVLSAETELKSQKSQKNSDKNESEDELGEEEEDDEMGEEEHSEEDDDDDEPENDE